MAEFLERDAPAHGTRRIGDPADEKAHFKSKVFRLWNLLAKALDDEDEGLALARDMLDLARGRNRMALIFCLERLCPRPNKRPVPFSFPRGAKRTIPRSSMPRVSGLPQAKSRPRRRSRSRASSVRGGSWSSPPERVPPGRPSPQEK